MKKHKTENIDRRRIIVTEPIDNIIHISFPTQYLMCSTLLRFQEHYESPEFKGKMFTLEEYMDYYAEKHGAFTYFQDYNGFNFPSKVFDFFDMCQYKYPWGRLTNKELKMTKLFSGHNNYIIATTRDSKTPKADFVHELAHGLFYTNREYCSNVTKILKKRGSSKYLAEAAKSLNDSEYRMERKNIIDEAQAMSIEEAVIAKVSSQLSTFHISLFDNFRKFIPNISSFVLLETQL